MRKLFIDKEGCVIKAKTTLLASFRFAGQGIIFSLNERNIRIHYLAAIVAITAGILLKISDFMWCVLILLIAVVISLEMINTAFEILVNMVSPEHNEDAGKVKDIAAGAVLIVAIAAVIIAYFMFVP